VEEEEEEDKMKENVIGGECSKGWKEENTYRVVSERLWGRNLDVDETVILKWIWN
jgi:hypothetical protein